MIDYPRGIPVLIFVLVTGITVLSVFAIERGEQERDAADVARKAQAMTSAIERRAYTSSAYLRAGAALLSTQDEVTPELFRRFVSELRLDANYRGAEGIGWAPVVEAGELAEFESRLGRSRRDEQHVTPTIEEQPRDLLTPILFLQPDTVRNRRALGYDMYSEPTRRAAMDLAAANDRPTASGPVVLVQEGGGDAAGFLIMMPVFEGLSSSRELKGFIYSPFNASQFLASASDLVSYDDIGARLLDGETVDPVPMARSDAWLDGRSAVVREVNLANRTMMLEVQSTREEGLSSMSMITLLFGLAVASLLMLVARLLTQQTLEDRRAISWFEEQNSIRNSLTRELNHRVKNLFAVILAIVQMSARDKPEAKEVTESIAQRIRALLTAHEVSQGELERPVASLRALVETSLAPYRSRKHTAEIDGPEIMLPAKRVTPLGLVLHELTTNAVKYGAWQSEGTVHVTWTEKDGRVALEWRESGADIEEVPEHKGFGSLLMTSAARQFGGTLERKFTKDGLRVSIELPVED